MKKFGPRLGSLGGTCLLIVAFGAFAPRFAQATTLVDAPLALPEVGTAELKILKPDLLELTLITTKAPAPARPTEWNFVAANFQYLLPTASKFVVLADGLPVTVQSVGFKRRPIYAAFRKRDLRIGNHLYLKLNQSIGEGKRVEVLNPDGTLWQHSATRFEAVLEPQRFSPAIHVNQGGYVPSMSKKAMVGFFLGTFGELEVPQSAGFKIVEHGSGNVVHQGSLTHQPDEGYNYQPWPYQKVYEADFSNFQTPGKYRLMVDGLGTSHPFRIDEGAPALFTRSYALGLYHQRCGTNNTLPFTRHEHEACHTVDAEVPTMSFSAVNNALANFTADYNKNPRHTAPRLANVGASLYPFVNTGRINVSGGHHDAGDYSKYTINSAQLVHALVFAVDNYAGVAELDNLGLPESGDGVSDLLQEAKWEADFLARMQDADGGFYFLVYPRNRSYEDNVLPDRGDPQVVFPKTTSATAAAVAALAQTASSPKFKQAYPEAAAEYLSKARKGWDFLQAAFSKHGRDGAYQKISHYGDQFMHDDEVIWAATELFLATGDRSYENEVIGKLDPSSRSILAQGWIRLWEGYGCAIRSYAFGARSGRRSQGDLNAGFLAQCEAELMGAAEEQVRFSRQTSYGSSFPDPNKTHRTAGWYFSVNQAFEIATAAQLDARAEFLDTILLNMNYEGGCNPVNVSFVTGLGYKRQREMVHQYAINDRRSLPPSGLPLGNIQKGFQADLPIYGNELSGLTFPHDYASEGAYAPYDTWGDAYNLTTEFVHPQQARSVATLAYIMAMTSVKNQAWKPGSATIQLSKESVPVGGTAQALLSAPGLDLSSAQIVWEARSQEPVMQESLEITPEFIGRYWVEAEAVLPDGRRIFAVNELQSSAVAPEIQSAGRSRVLVSGTEGQSFTIEGSTDLMLWVPLGTGTFTSGTFEWVDEYSASLEKRFYRVVTGQ